ncbi:MAG: hypothetical protein HOG38_00585, partial [Candidatus Pelagibacter sp.]|nr:hypothetical protein [Candidatus Pelagibacter sp.]
KNDDTLIKISKIKFEGDEKINRKILSLTGLKESSDFSDSYLLILNSKKNKDIASKNSAGNATSYKISIDINISIVDPINNEKIIKSKVFNSSFTYNNNQNKFELSQDEKNILNNLIEAASKKIVMYLSL